MVRRLAVVLALAPAGCGSLAPPPTLFPVGTAWVASLEDAIQPPLVADDSRIFAATRGGSVLALDGSTGVVLWRVEGRPGRLALGGGILALRREDGTVWGMDPASGSDRFKADPSVPGALPPVIEGARLLLAGDGLAALDARTGRLLFSFPGPPAATAPVATGPWVLVGEKDGTLRCRDGATGVSLWTQATGRTLLAPPVVDDRRRILLGTASRGFVALDLENKGRRLWRWKVGTDVQVPGVIFGGKVLVASREAVLYALDRGNGSMAWLAALPSRPISRPLLVGNAVLVACQETDVVGLDARTGKKLGSLTTPAEIRTEPIVIGTRLFVGLRDRSIVAIDLGVQPPPSPSPSPSPSASASPSPPAATLPTEKKS